MDLAAVEEPLDHTLVLDPESRAQAGIHSTEMRPDHSVIDLRLVGRVRWDESALHEVTVRVGGWVREVGVAATGAPVERGQVLLWLDSPELVAAQREFLHLFAEGAAAARSALVDAARERLRHWGFPDDFARALQRRGAPLDPVPVRAPAAGVVVEKHVLPGAAVAAGDRLFRVASLETVWIEAQMFEDDAALVAPGQRAEVAVFARPGWRGEATVAQVEPWLDPDSRTARVRLSLDNRAHLLWPGMLADVRIRIDRGERLLVPASAVLYTGPRRLVFLDLSGGRVAPVEVQLGPRAGDRFEVVDGLAPGQRVVTSGVFWIAAESRLRAALAAWETPSERQ